MRPREPSGGTREYPAEMVIGTACRLVPVKGLPVLLDAFSRVRASFGNVRLEIAGSGPEELPLRRQVEALGLSRHIAFLGWQQDLAAVFSRWDVFAMSSPHEGFSLATLEAMMAGLPVVCASAGGIAELVEDGRTGWLRTPLNVLGEFQLTGTDLDGARVDAQLSFPGQIKQILTNLRTGPPTTIADLPALQRNPAVKVLLAPSDRTIFIAINTQKPTLNNVQVRQALNYAVDKQAIVANVLFGAGELMDSPMAPSLFGYCKVGTYEFNQAKAKQLLAEAGVAPGTPISLVHPTGRYVQDKEATQALAGYLREVGPEPDLQTMDWPSYIRTITTPADKNTTELHLLGWAPAFLDGAQQMLQFLSSYHPPAGLATSFYRDADVDRLIQAAERELNPDRRKELYCQASKIVWQEAPWIFLWVQRFPIVYSAKVTGVSSLPNEKFSALYARPAQ